MNAGVAAVMMPLITFTYSRMPALAVRPPLPAGAAEAASQVASSGEAVGLVPWLVSLLPVNPIAAAASGNMVSLILFTLLLAVAIAKSPPASRETLLAFFRALGDAMLVLVRWVVAAAPIGIFGLMLPLAAHGGAGVAGAVGAYIVIYSVACIAGVLLVYPAMAVFGRVPLSTFARAALPAQLIAFSSSSSVASLPALVGAAAELRMPARVTGFVLPLAVSVFKFAGPVSWTTGALFIGHFYGIPLGAAAAPDHRVRGRVPGLRGPGRAARRVPDADAAVPGHRPARRRDRHPDRRRRAARSVRHGVERHRRSGRRGAGGAGGARGAGRCRWATR